MKLFITFCFAIVSLLLVTPAYMQSEFVCPEGFAGYLPPRLIVGEQARVMPETVLNVRPQPTTQLARVGTFLFATNFTVLDGPRCNEGYVWWQSVSNGVTGWVAEGSRTNGEYWLEPRGVLVIMLDANGIERRFIRADDGTLEREGCLRPPDDYTRVQQGYALLNARTLAMLDNAQRIYEQAGGHNVNFRQAITQGSYNPGGVDASFGTHDGGGAVDISVRRYTDFSVLTDDIEPLVDALRVAGFAAWLRDTGELYPDSPIHIHAIAIGDAEASPIAQQQVNGDFGYLRGFNGLPRDDGNYGVDRHGGPVICRWMVEMGFEDLRGER